VSGSRERTASVGKDRSNRNKKPTIANWRS
jgi:hypothetical protein